MPSISFSESKSIFFLQYYTITFWDPSFVHSFICYTSFFWRVNILESIRTSKDINNKCILKLIEIIDIQ